MINVSVFYNNPKKYSFRYLKEVLEEIKTGRFKDLVLKIRKLDSECKVKEANDLKSQLPFFTISGMFEGKPDEKYLKFYSGFVGIELDDIIEHDAERIINIVESIPTTYCWFKSSSGNGMEIIVPVNSSAENHIEAFKQVADFYEAALGVKIDRSWPEITKSFYYSSHPNLYMKSNCKKFIVVMDGELPGNPISDDEFNEESATTKLEEFAQSAQFAPTTEKKSMNDGKENNSDSQYDPSKQKEKLKDELFEKLGKTPFLPDEIFTNLPSILKEGSDCFDFPRERDLYLLGAITVLSGVMPNVYGTYDRKTVFPNLYLFVVAPPANGKGTLTYAQNLARKLHDRFLAVSIEKLNEYKKAMTLYKASLKANKKSGDINNEENSNLKRPQKPNMRILFLPGNSSSASIIQLLCESDGNGIIFETEADTLAASFKQDWGNYSDMLRKAFQHESISLSRKTDNEFIEISTPKISVVISGTLSQVKGIIKTAEDGLLSRFMFYAFKTDAKWRDVSPINKPNLTEQFDLFADKVLGMFDILESSKTQFNLSDQQWKKLNDRFANWLLHFKNFEGDVGGSIIVRLGLIVFRISMVLSVLRKFENQDNSQNLICIDEDFDTAIKIFEALKTHSLLILDLLPDSELSDREKFLQKFLDVLPMEQFQRNIAVILGKKMGIQERTVDKYLKKLVSIRRLENMNYGNYKKVNS